MKTETLTKKMAKLVAQMAKLVEQAQTKPTKAPKAKKFSTKAIAKALVAPMTVNAAKKFVASFEGRRGRRPAEFYAAEKLIRKATRTAKKEAKQAAETKEAVEAVQTLEALAAETFNAIPAPIEATIGPGVPA